MCRLMRSDHKYKGAFFIMDFYKILKALTADNNLTFSDILVMSVLVTHAQYEQDKTVQLSAKEIHEEFERLSIVSIKRSIKRLSDLHYIKTIPQHPHPSKHTILIDIGQPQAKPWRTKKPKPNNDMDISKYAAVINKF